VHNSENLRIFFAVAFAAIQLHFDGCGIVPQHQKIFKISPKDVKRIVTSKLGKEKKK
jgi:hypothetical protein